MDTIYDCIIVGSGISGLSFAHHLVKEGENILVLEKEKQIGGQIRTTKGNQNTFWAELGAHTCYNSYTHLLSIIEDIQAIDEIIPCKNLKYVLYKEGKIKSVFSAISIIPLIFNFPKIFFRKQAGKTVKEFFSPLVGKSNYIPLFSNLFRAVLSQKADNYPAEIFLKRRKERRQDVPRKFTFKSGISTIINKIVEYDKIQVLSGIEVTSIFQNDETDPLLNIATAAGQTFKARNIALATDPATISLLLKNVDSEISKLLSTISLSQSESLNIIINKNKVNLKEIAGIIPLGNEFTSIVSRDIIPDNNLRAFTFHFQQSKSSSEEQLHQICSVLEINPSDILSESACSHVLPSLGLEHLNLAEKIDQTRNIDNIYIPGNYFYGLSIEDCVHRAYDESIRYKKNKTK